MKPIENHNGENSSTPMPMKLNRLDKFRENWQRELKAQNQLKEKGTEAQEQQDIAENLFQKAVELERKGKVYDALPFYEKAVQILPEIEKIFYERQKLKATTTTVPNEQTEEKSLPANFNEFEKNGDFDLYEMFKSDLGQDGGSHISELPIEILLNALRWVVSNQLKIARVSKGMYMLARDEELWRSACIRVWGPDVGTPDKPGCNEEICQTYNSWRHMFIERTRVLFNGCYISKANYLRMGENNLQHKLYGSVKLVEYFRYIRFLPEGKVYIMNTADDPGVGVTKLRNVNNLPPDVLKGHYYIKGRVVSCLLRNQRPQQRQRRSSNYADEHEILEYHIDFKILDTPKRKSAKLIWLHYAITEVRNKVETSTVFDLISTKYPKLLFSPVRSYHLVSDAPLA